jgi:hypothetical protein
LLPELTYFSYRHLNILPRGKSLFKPLNTA